MQQANPDENIVLVGDFNAFEFNDGYVDVLGVIRGDEAGAEQVLTHVDSPLTSLLIDGSQLIADPARRYSYLFGGNAQNLDHVLVNEAVIADAGGLRVDHARINADFGVDNFGDEAVPLRTSDHDPVRLAIAVPAFASADLSVSASATPGAVAAGERIVFDATVANMGPGAARFAAVAAVFDTLLTPAITRVADGWTCNAPLQDATTTTVTCTTPSMAANTAAAFALEVIAPRVASGELRMAFAADSQTADPANADNQAVAVVAIANFTTCAAEGFAGAQLALCRQVCEAGHAAVPLARLTQVYARRYGTQPPCAR
jgi:hypothetical protein